jgi:hypothetical protein
MMNDEGMKSYEPRPPFELPGSDVAGFSSFGLCHFSHMLVDE